MFWGKMKMSLACMTAAGMALAVPSIAQAGVIVKSSGPSSGTYPVGRQIEDDATITLREGDRITILTDDGTKVMQGPGRFRAGEGATRTNARFSNLTRTRAARRVRTGAVRAGVGSSEPVRNPNLWFVNVAAGGSVCLLDLEGIRLWRPDAEAAQTYRIVDPASGSELEVEFVETEAVRALDPEAMAIEDGVSYTILAPDADDREPRSVDIRFVSLDPEGDYSRPDLLAAALYEKGCTGQLALLADTLEEEVK